MHTPPSMITHENILIIAQMAQELRYLCADIVQNANSGHPGTPMGLAEVATTLSYHLRINPKNPLWLNRDRLIFSGGHASALLYALLHLWGFDVSLQDLQAFRTLHSKTPGHPEFPLTPGVEITTGPLGQGIANAVGFSFASKYAKELLGANTHNKPIIDHNIYCICGDGDLQEGISYEACSLAGLHKLDNLIIIYDSNAITIEGDVKIAFNEQVRERFLAQGFEVFECDGHDILAIDSALNAAKNAKAPSLIIATTIIGKGAPTLEGSHQTHGAPIGADIIAQGKREAGLSEECFHISESVKFFFQACMERGASLEAIWNNNLTPSAKQTIQNLTNPDFSAIDYPQFTQGESIATRASNGKILNAISQAIPSFLGGSADLAPSNNTHLIDSGDFPKGKNLHFGIREHAMGALCNGIANYGLFLPFCATFFVFSDYMSPSVRVASIMRSKVFYIWTHDSIGVGEDGATHEPIEQLSHFRAMPNLLTFRPADANENIACWQVALESNTPCAFVLSRQNLPILAPSTKAQVARGAYLIKSSESSVQITLLASGSEVSLALEAAKILEEQNIGTQVVSMPCFELLCAQEQDYLDTLFVGKTLAIEAASAQELYRFAHKVFGMQGFGCSAKGSDLFAHFGFSPENIAKCAKELL